MKIWVFKAKNLFFSVFLLLILVSLLTFSFVWFRPAVLSAFGSEKALPIYSVEGEGKNLAITFDCAWGADDIPEILEVLKREGVTATFFVVGQWAQKFPQMVKMISDQGHDVANHSYSHLKMSSLDKKKAANEISKCGKTLSAITGRPCELFRAPYGDYNQQLLSTARDLGYYTIQWSVDSLDWKPGISQEEILARIMGRVKPGSILLFHNDTTHTAAILSQIIADLKKTGYSFLPVSRMIYRDHYIIDAEGRQKTSK